MLIRPSLDFSASARSSCCFRTDADGRITLTRDWRTLFLAAQSVGHVALQTRHHFARLVTFTSIPTFTWSADGTRAHDDSGTLQLHAGSWRHAHGLLRACPCCDSPGRIEIRNASGAEFLQFCPLPASDPLHWADFLAAVSAPPVRAPSFKIAPFESAPALVRLSRTAFPLAAPASTLAPLIAAFGHENIPLRVTLRTAEISHHREFVAHEVSVDEGLLALGGGSTRLHLALPAVSHLALTAHTDSWALHAIGHDHRRLCFHRPMVRRAPLRVSRAPLT